MTGEGDPANQTVPGDDPGPGDGPAPAPIAGDHDPMRRFGDLTMGSRWRSVLAMATASLRADRLRTVATIALDIAVGLAGPFLAVGAGLIVDAAITGRSFTGPVAVLSAAVAVLLTVSVLSNRLRLRLEENVAHHVELDVMRMVTGLPSVAHHENPAHLHRIDRLLEESWLVAMAVPALVLTVEIIVRFAVTVALLAAVDGRLLLLPLAVVPTLWAGVVAERIRLRALDRRAEVGRRADDLFEVVGETASGAELRTSGVGGHLLRVHDASMDVVAADERSHRAQGAWRLALGRAIFAAGFGAGLLLVASRAAAGDVSAGEVVMVIGLAGQVIGQATSVSSRLNWLNWALTGVRHYVWLLDYDAAHRGPSTHPRAAGRRDPGDVGEGGPPVAAPERLVDGIRFRAVTFAYPGTERVVLRHLDLHVPAGTILAVVGDNGAGKTTLVKLLLGFYRPTSGSIEIDGVPLDDIDITSWRQRVAAALQDHTRPEVLMGEAIGMGDLGHLGDRTALWGAAARSGADAVVAVVPGGLDAQLGLEWAGGTELSGGEWQRLAVGRSAMRTDALLLVLDEPTAALDPTAEQALFEHYVGAGRRPDAVTIVISHRLSTVRMADHIVVLHDGAVVEAGSHEQLLADGGRYSHLFELQARAYR